MNRKEFMKLHNLECKNMQWSWFFVNHTERYIVVQIFYEQNKNKVYSPEWGKKTQPSHKEFKEYLELVENEDYDIKAVHAFGHLDLESNQFHLDGYNGKTLLDARLEIDFKGNAWFYPKKNNVAKISSKE